MSDRVGEERVSQCVSECLKALSRCLSMVLASLCQIIEKHPKNGCFFSGKSLCNSTSKGIIKYTLNSTMFQNLALYLVMLMF